MVAKKAQPKVEKMSDFVSRIFGASPVKPLQEHIAKAVECAEQLIILIDAVIADDSAKVVQTQEKITILENEADDLKKELRLHLPKSLFMPVARGDLLSVLRIQDNIANKTKDVAGLIVGRQMRFPPPLTEVFRVFVDKALAAARQAQKTVGELDDLFESGFKGKEVEITQSMIHELDRAENETDKAQVEVRTILFGIEKDYPAVDVMFMYKVIDLVGDVADAAQRVGSRLQLLLAR